MHHTHATRMFAVSRWHKSSTIKCQYQHEHHNCCVRNLSEIISRLHTLNIHMHLSVWRMCSSKKSSYDKQWRSRNIPHWQMAKVQSKQVPRMLGHAHVTMSVLVVCVRTDKIKAGRRDWQSAAQTWALQHDGEGHGWKAWWLHGSWHRGEGGKKLSHQSRQHAGDLGCLKTSPVCLTLSF